MNILHIKKHVKNYSDNTIKKLGQCVDEHLDKMEEVYELKAGQAKQEREEFNEKYSQMIIKFSAYYEEDIFLIMFKSFISTVSAFIMEWLFDKLSTYDEELRTDFFYTIKNKSLEENIKYYQNHPFYTHDIVIVFKGDQALSNRDHDLALSYFKYALLKMNELSDKDDYESKYKKKIAPIKLYILYQMGFSYLYKLDYKSTIYAFNEILKIKDIDRGMKYVCYKNIMFAYGMLKEMEKSEEFFNKAFDLCGDDLSSKNELQQIKRLITESHRLNKYTKSSPYIEQQKIESVIKSQQSLFDLVNDEKTPSLTRHLHKQINQYGLTQKGLKLSLSEQNALHSLQTLFTRTGYYDRCSEGKIEPFSFLISDYLDAFGVTKYKSKRGKLEYSNGERKHAVDSLVGLSQKQNVIYYVRKHFVEMKKGKPVYESKVIKDIAPIITIRLGMENLSDNEVEEVLNDRIINLTRVEIVPHRCLTDDTDNYFIMKPEDYIKSIKKSYGKQSVYVYRFIDFLIYNVFNLSGHNKELKDDLFIDINFMTLAKKLRMDTDIKNRNKKRIREILIKAYDIAQKEGYIKGYEIDVKGVTKDFDRLYINKEGGYYLPSKTDD